MDRAVPNGMTVSPLSTIPAAESRRIVLVDFDWEDADLVPALLRHPQVAVRLVAGAHHEQPGMRLAEICGLPRTVDLADLTREIFDVALVSERSPRRTQIESLLLALGTPSQSPEEFLRDQPEAPDATPGIEAPLALHAAAFENALGGEDFNALVEQALPDLTEGAPTTPQPVRTNGQRLWPVSSLDNFPSHEDRQALEDALRNIMDDTGARIAELHAGRADGLERVVHMGPEDPLLRGLVELAREANAPQVVARLNGPLQGKIWGAWPFRTTQHRGVLAAAAIDPSRGVNPWLHMVEDLRHTWDRHDRELAAPAFPMIPESAAGWLEPGEFRSRLELAVERHQRDGMRFAVQHLVFPPPADAVQYLAAALPQQLRDTDTLCRPVANEVLLLTAGPAAGFAQVRRRLLTLWDRAWRAGGATGPPPPLRNECVEMSVGSETEAFLATVTRWLAIGDSHGA
ncbi:MAG: hypothetical protein ABIS67_13020 [Candidatus Eisenbacteria bacterium]